MGEFYPFISESKLTLSSKKKNIANQNGICYNASRQKGNGKSIWTKNEASNRVPAQLGASSFLFTMAKHPPGYLLLLSFLSSHLQTRWQTTPAITVTKKEIATSIQTPPPVVRGWQDNKAIIQQSFEYSIRILRKRNPKDLVIWGFFCNSEQISSVDKGTRSSVHRFVCLR